MNGLGKKCWTWDFRKYEPTGSYSHRRKHIMIVKHLRRKFKEEFKNKAATVSCWQFYFMIIFAIDTRIFSVEKIAFRECCIAPKWRKLKWSGRDNQGMILETNISSKKTPPNEDSGNNENCSQSLLSWNLKLLKNWIDDCNNRETYGRKAKRFNFSQCRYSFFSWRSQKIAIPCCDFFFDNFLIAACVLQHETYDAFIFKSDKWLSSLLVASVLLYCIKISK